MDTSGYTDEIIFPSCTQITWQLFRLNYECSAIVRLVRESALLLGVLCSFTVLAWIGARVFQPSFLCGLYRQHQGFRSNVKRSPIKYLNNPSKNFWHLISSFFTLAKINQVLITVGKEST